MKKKWIILVIVCMGIILVHSLVPESKSAQESLWLTNHILNPLLSWFGMTADEEIVRKIAHIIEFCILTVVLILWFKKSVRAFYAGFTIAFLDESLQIITGRGALVTDIWIDLIGVTIGVGIGSLISRHNEKQRGVVDV